MLPPLPSEAVAILQKIKDAGGRGYLVGGALRDLLLGRTPHDWDFAATLPLSELLALFPEARPIGGLYGTVQLPFAGAFCEVTPCRVEGPYSDRRHPDTVQFLPDILADLARRDFTVNAMAYDGEVLFDPFGGQEDLAARLIRCVGAPPERFAEDPLRILRLFRLSGELAFLPEAATLAAANAAMGTLALLPRERVRDEVQRILLSAKPYMLGPIIAKGGLAGYGLTFAPRLTPLADVPAEPLCRWWALVMLCGANASALCEAFGIGRRFEGELAECTRLYRMGPADDKTALKFKLSRTKLDYAPISATFAAVSPAFANEPVLFAGVRLKKEPYRLQDLAISGDMLLAEGLRGERLGQVLGELLAVVIKNPSLNQLPVLLGLARGLKQLL